MAESNSDLIFEENDFLNRHPGASGCSASVRRWDEDFLRSEHILPDFGGSWKLNIDFLDRNGQIIGSLGAPEKHVFPWFTRTRNETVVQALVRLGDLTSKIKFAVNIGRNRTLTLYRLPKGFDNAASWLAARREAALKALRDSD